MNLEDLAKALSDCGITIKSGIFCLGGESEVKELSREDHAAIHV